MWVIVGLLPYLLVVAISIEIARRSLRDRRVASKEAARRGFITETRRASVPNIDFALFRGRRGPLSLFGPRRVRNRVSRPGEGSTAFHYEGDWGFGSMRWVKEYGCVIAPTRFDAPHLRISHRTTRRLRRPPRYDEVRVGIEAFDELYLVRCADDGFARALLSPAVINWMLDRTSGQGRVRMEFRGPWMLAAMENLPDSELPGFYDWASWAIAHLPDRLTTQYPLASVVAPLRW
jgi:hypothetical protein